MIKLTDILNEDFFPDEEPSAFEGEKEAIQKYIEAVELDEPNGTTIASVIEDLKDASHATQLKTLIELAKNDLLRMSYSNVHIRPNEVEKIFNAQKDIATNAVANYNLNEENPCWKGYKQIGMKEKNGKQVPNCVPIDEAFFIGEDDIDEYDVENVDDIKEFLQFIKEYKSFLAEAQCDCVYEAEYHGHQVQLGKPMQGDIKKFKVYVKNPKGKVVKVNFGAHGMNIKKNNPKRRKAYRARHHCDNPGPRTKANYWSCRKW
jgi:hypothetical protein